MELSQVGSRKKRRAGRAGVGCSGKKKKGKRKKEKEAGRLALGCGRGKEKKSGWADSDRKKKQPRSGFQGFEIFSIFWILI
jgi:hypothetical protein